MGYRVFISYSRANQDQRERLIKHLTILEANETIKTWHDGYIEAGDLWRDVLDRVMSEAEVVLFLLSAEFFASGFIRDAEVPRMLERHRADGVLIIPIIVDYCSWKEIEWLNQFQVLPIDGQPVSAQKPHSKAWCQVVEAIGLRLKNSPPHKVIPTPQMVNVSGMEPEWASVQKLLPKLPGEARKLFGRDEALGWLDETYDDQQVAILSLVGRGGMGKSAIVRHWLESRNLTAKGVTRFLGCSFYSRSKRQQSGSSDQFLIQTLELLGEPEPGLLSAWDRGQRLAHLVTSEPTVLVLDGLEPLQYGIGPHNLEGYLKDPGIHGLLAGLVTKPGKSICIITSRLNLKDDSLQSVSCVQKQIEELSTQAARELLISRGVRGDQDKIDEAVEYLERIPLALVLAAEYLHTFAEGQAGDVKEIPLLSEQTKEGRHAKSVMNAYENALRRDEDPLDLELLGVIGLFDRPVKWHWLKELCDKPLITGVTDNLVQAREDELLGALSRLWQWEILDHRVWTEKSELYAHQLIQEYFGEKLKSENKTGWHAAHGVLFDYLSSAAPDYPGTVSEMELLYHAVEHGCKADRHQDIIDKVYRPRIQQGEKYFSTSILGTFGDELAALTGFFDSLWDLPVSTLTDDAKAYVLHEAGYNLRALGRLVEATNPMEASLSAYISRNNWIDATRNAGQLSQVYLTIGELPKARHYAEQSVKLADRLAGCNNDRSWQAKQRASLAKVLHHEGDMEEAEALFCAAEDMQKDIDPQRPYLFSQWGFMYCDLLLSKKEYQKVQTRAVRSLEWKEESKTPNHEIALDYLSLGRAHLLQYQQEGANAAEHLNLAEAYLKLASRYLRQARRLDYRPRLLLARAELHHIRGNINKWQADLHEAKSIAEYGRMELYKADCHLEYARLHLAQGKKEAAREHLKAANEMIKQMGYRRRGEEVEAIASALR